MPVSAPPPETVNTFVLHLEPAPSNSDLRSAADRGGSKGEEKPSVHSDSGLTKTAGPKVWVDGQVSLVHLLVLGCFTMKFEGELPPPGPADSDN